MESGIYCIRCLVNNKRYIGSTINFKKRKTHHFSMLRNNKYKNNMQEDFIKYGEENFVFEILQYIHIEDKELSKCEISWINKYNTRNAEFGYNENYATRTNKNARKKISESRKGKVSNARKLDMQQCFDVMKWIDYHNYVGFNASVSNELLAEKFNVSKRTIIEIRYGNHWSCKI